MTETKKAFSAPSDGTREKSFSLRSIVAFVVAVLSDTMATLDKAAHTSLIRTLYRRVLKHQQQLSGSRWVDIQSS